MQNSGSYDQGSSEEWWRNYFHFLDRLWAARRLLTIWGRKKFGGQALAEERLEQLCDIDRLERIAERVFDATSWDDLLNTP